MASSQSERKKLACALFDRCHDWREAFENELMDIVNGYEADLTEAHRNAESWRQAYYSLLMKEDKDG